MWDARLSPRTTSHLSVAAQQSTIWTWPSRLRCTSMMRRTPRFGRFGQHSEHREVVSAASGPVQDAQPHVSLAAFDDGDMPAVEQILLHRLDAVRRLPLTLTSLGFFLTQESVAFLGVVPTARLLDVHRRVKEAITSVTTGFRPYYMPDALMFHCTIASGVRHHARVVSAVATARLPMSATVEASE